jgi:hypothetical protein
VVLDDERGRGCETGGERQGLQHRSEEERQYGEKNEARHLGRRREERLPGLPALQQRERVPPENDERL